MLMHRSFYSSRLLFRRSHTPLIYRAIPVWFVKVSTAGIIGINAQLVANNKETRWVPQNVGDGRFGNWIQNARDWNISRNRYWGTPIPLWVSDDFEEVRRPTNGMRRMTDGFMIDCMHWLYRSARGVVWRYRSHRPSS